METGSEPEHPADGGGGGERGSVRASSRRSTTVRVVLGGVVVGTLALAALALGLVAMADRPSVAAAATPGCGAGAPKLTVHGTGTATGTPDLLTLSLAVAASGPTANTALSEDNSSTSAVVGALTSGGVVKKDVQTTGLSIQPTYGTKGALTGYSVSNSVVAKIRDFATAGAVIDAAAGAAGNAVRIDSLAFSIADPRGVEDQARQDAVRQAVSHAATMAAAAGERLGPVCTLTDDSSTSASSAAGSVAQPFKLSTTVPLQPGTQQANAQVTVVYSLETSRPEGT